MATNDDPYQALRAWLDDAAANVRSNWGSVTELQGPFGVHGVWYGTDARNGEYAVVGFTLPDGFYADLGDDVVGELAGIRVFRDPDVG